MLQQAGLADEVEEAAALCMPGEGAKNRVRRPLPVHPAGCPLPPVQPARFPTQIPPDPGRMASPAPTASKGCSFVRV